jgi:hypothetical protein
MYNMHPSFWIGKLKNQVFVDNTLQNKQNISSEKIIKKKDYAI